MIQALIYEVEVVVVCVVLWSSEAFVLGSILSLHTAFRRGIGYFTNCLTVNSIGQG
jgi:hypothetical protein